MPFKAIAVEHRADGTQETRATSAEYETRVEAQMYADVISVTWVDQSVQWEVVEVGGSKNEGTVVYTNAPPQYDYSYVEVVDAAFAKHTGNGGSHPIIRKLRIHGDTPEEQDYRVNYQGGRYASGMHSVWTQEEFDYAASCELVELLPKVKVPPPSPTGATCPDCDCPADLDDVGSTCRQCGRGIIVGSGYQDHEPKGE